MKIHDSQRIMTYRSYQQSLEQRTGGTTGQRRKDEVQFSAEAMQLLGARSQVQDPDRAERIEQLKDAVATGTYHVSDDELVERLLPFVR